MKVLWRSDLDQGKHDPLEITHVVTKSGSQISAALVVPVSDEQLADRHFAGTPAEETVGLLEVIEAQLAAIDELGKAAKADKALQEWADQFPDVIADLCVALGYAARPIAPTGIPELDILVRLSE